MLQTGKNVPSSDYRIGMRDEEKNNSRIKTILWTINVYMRVCTARDRFHKLQKNIIKITKYILNDNV